MGRPSVNLPLKLGGDCGGRGGCGPALLGAHGRQCAAKEGVYHIQRRRAEAIGPGLLTASHLLVRLGLRRGLGLAIERASVKER